MRDPVRIYPFTAELIRIWGENPDLRFGQLMTLLLEKVEESGKDPFYLEDEEMIEYLRRLL